MSTKGLRNVFGVLVLMAAALAGCRPAGPKIPAGWTKFTSDRHHYSAAYPPDWQVLTPEGEWTAELWGNPWEPGVDSYSLPTADPWTTYEDPDVWILVTSRETNPGESLKEWAARFPVWFAMITDICHLVEENKIVMVGGEPGVQYHEDCPYMHSAKTIMTVHHGRGYYISFWYPHGATQQVLDLYEDFLGSFAFTR